MYSYHRNWVLPWLVYHGFTTSLIIDKFPWFLGDNGGPLVQNGTLIGVINFSFGCGDPKYPGVYARVSAVRDWIKMVAGV